MRGKGRRVAPGPENHVFQGKRVEMVAHVLADVGPHREQHALALVVAGPVLVGRAEVPGDDRTVHRAHDLAQGDLLGHTGQHVASPHPAL